MLPDRQTDRTKLSARVALGVVVLSGIVGLVWFSPAEHTLGHGIRAVYVHVTLVWTGMAAFAAAAVCGAIALVHSEPRARVGADRWARAIGLVGLASYAAGVAISLLAARINWGAISWTEPRLAMSLRVVVLAVIVEAACPFFETPRARGACRVALAVFMLWALGRTPLIAHPRNPIATSNAWAIRGTFYGLFALFCAIAAWIATGIHRRANGGPPASSSS